MSQYPLRIKLKKNSLNFHEGAQFGLKIIQINGLKQYLYIESETGAIISADLYYTNKEVFDDISPSIGYYKDEVGEEKIIEYFEGDEYIEKLKNNDNFYTESKNQ